MKKMRLFLSNLVVYGIGGVLNKMVPIIMVPIITKLMPSTEYYGISDTLTIITSLFSSLALMGMYDAMFRIFFEKEDLCYKRKVCSTSFLFTVIIAFFVSFTVFMLRNQFSVLFLKSGEYSYLIIIVAITIFVSSTNNIVAAPTRMENKRRVYIIANCLTSLIAYSISVVLLISGKYIIALPIGILLSNAFLEMFYIVLNKEWFSFRCFDWQLLKSLLYIAIPIAPNILIFWVYNSCDRFMITSYLGMGQEAVYSVGAKIGQASQLFYLAFSGGWQFFSFSTMKEKRRVEDNSRIFEYLMVMSLFATLFICAISSLVFSVMFDKRYQLGYIVAPYLFLAPLVQMLFQVVATQFTIEKKTYFNTLFLIAGVLANVVLNYVLIPLLGIEGASIATVIGYAVATILCISFLVHFKLFLITNRMIGVMIVFGILFSIWRLWYSQRICAGILIFMLSGLIYSLFYKKDLRILVESLYKRKG